MLRRQKHVLSQSTTPFACTLLSPIRKVGTRSRAVSTQVLRCEPFFPLQHSKTPRTPNLSKICPSDRFWGFQTGGLKFVKNLSKFVRKLPFFKFRQIIDRFQSPGLETPKNNQSLGQILDKFGVRGVFDCCNKWYHFRPCTTPAPSSYITGSHPRSMAAVLVQSA